MLLSQLPVKVWQGAKAAMFSEDGESHEHFKKVKTQAECERSRLQNARMAGEVFDRADGDRIQAAWASALKLALAERRATAPQVLAGKDEASIADFFDSQDHRLLADLSNLESSYGTKSLPHTARPQKSPPNPFAPKGAAGFRYQGFPRLSIQCASEIIASEPCCKRWRIAAWILFP